MPLIYDDEAQRPATRLVFDDEQAKPATAGKFWENDPIVQTPKPEAGEKFWANDPIAKDEFGGTVLEKDEFGGYILPDKTPSLVFDDGKPAPAPAKPGKRTWTQAAGDTAIDLAKGAVGLGEAVIGVADLATGNTVGKGWGELGFDPARTKQILSEGYSDSRQEANRNVADAKGFLNTAGAMIDNPSMAVGAVVESAPMMLGGAAAVRAAATRMLAARGLVAGSSEAAAFLSNPAVVARLTAVGSAAEGAMTAGNIQEQGRQAGRDWTDTAPSAVAGGALTAVIGAATSKIPGFRDAEVGAALAGMGGAKRQGLITAGKEIAKGTFKEGVLEEMPQSAQEQVFTNLALGKPWDEGVPEAAAQGMIAGAGMGGGLTTYTAGRNALASTVAGPAAAPSPVDAPAAPQSQAAAPAAAKPATAMRPEVRLAELELATQGRDLTAQEQGEFSTLLTAMDAAEANPDPFNPTQAPAFEDVPDFAQAPEAGNPAMPVTPGSAAQAANDPIVGTDPQTLTAGAVVSWPVNGKQVSGVVVSTPAAGESVVVRATGAEAGAGARTGGVFNVPVAKLVQAQTNTTAAPTGAPPVKGEKINKAWTAFHPESGTLNIPRADMPQIKAEHRGAMVNFLNARGITSAQDEVAANSLKPTQTEFSPAKVEKAKGFTGPERSILVSSDGHVLDGHHQWLSKVESNQPVKVIRLDASIDSLLSAMREFPSAGMTKDAIQATGINASTSAAPTGTPVVVAPTAGPKLNWFGFLKEKGVAPASVKKDTPQWTTLKAEFEGRKAGAVVGPAAVLPPAMPPGAVPAVSPAMPGAMPVTPTTNPSGQDLQNRDRSRAASVLQMSNIANNPDYMRLGASRTPDSGAPMVFPVGDDDIKLPEANLGRHDVAVMSDGQRVPFIYAVMDASQVEPSHFADGRVNPVYEFKVNGTVKALNNGRVAGLRAAHEQGTAETYKAELIKDAAVHGIAAEVIDRTPNPILVRAYSDISNTPNMAAKSQGQGLGMSPGELARQDAPLMDATVLTAYRPGDVGSAANRDFVRAFVGKMVQAGQDVAGMMTAGGTLSPAGRTRIQAAMVQSAYGDSELVGEMFDSQDTDIKTIGESLKTMAGQWADMRDSARMGAIDAQADTTDNLVQAVNLIRKARQDRTSLYDLVNQPDLMTGQAPDDLTRAMLRMFYGGPYLTTPFGREKVIAKLNAYTQAAMNSAHDADMFGERVTVAQILATITNEGALNANTTTPQDSNRSAAGVGNPGRTADDRGQAGPGQRDGSGGASPGVESAELGQAGRGEVPARSNQADQEPQAAAVAPKPAAKIEDAGQKIGGARKDRWKDRGLNLDDLDSMSESEGAELVTKANIWKPDYAAMVQAGTRPDTAAMIKVVHDALAAKPKDNTPQGRRRYVTMMQMVRQAYAEMASLDALDTKTPRKSLNDAAEALKVRLGLRGQDQAAIKEGRALLFSVYKGRSDPFVVNLTEEQRARKLVADGFPESGEPWKKRLTVRAFGGAGLTAKGIELVVEEADTLGTPITPDQLRAGAYRVITKAGKTLAYLPTEEDAQAAAKTIYEGKLKQGASDKAEPARPHLDILKRENLPQRIDRDAVADDFVKTFGFRGIEFGNWAAQDERQRIINMAYDGLHDLAQIMGVPPKALSLNGSLGMAFGARGGGKFAAHYEPGLLVINMTKLQGGGSMAHEWAHALDHYFGELNQEDAYTTKARGASGWYSEEQYKGVPRSRMEKADGKWVTVNKMRLDNMRPEMAKAFDDLMSALFSGQETKAEMVRSLELQLERTQALANSETDPQTKAMYQRMATSQAQNLEESRQEPEGKTYPKGRSQYAKQAQALSGKSVNGYWTRPTEMFARAFESWVFDQVVAMGGQSDYLVHGVEEARFAGGQYKGNPYPTGPERATINAAFDQLAKTIQTKDTDKGVAMFSRAGDKPGDLLNSYDRTEALEKQEAEAIARKLEQQPAAKSVTKPVTADQVDMFNPQGSLFARRASIGKSLPINQVQSVVDAIRSKWGNAPDVVVVTSMEDASIPKAVRDYDQKQRSLGASGSPEGFIYGGRVYVVADQLATSSDVIRVMFHESLGHLGLRGVFGTALNPILEQITQARRPEVVAKAKQYGLDMTKPEDALTAAEEVLATMAQDKPELGFVKRAIAAVRTWLRANVPGFADMRLTDAEIVNSYILPASAFVQGRKAGAVQGTALSRGIQTGTAAFKAWFEGSKVVNKDGTPLRVYHATTRDFAEFKSGEGIETVNDNPQKALGFFFTDSLDYVNGYIEHPETAGAFADDARIMPVYLALRNPKVMPLSKMEDIEQHWSLAKGKKLRADLESKGHDGIIFKGDRSSEYVVFAPGQIKSAIGNNGNYDATNPDIRYSRNSLGGDPVPPVTGVQANVWTAAKTRVMKLTSPENIDKLIYEFQDKHIDLKRIQSHIKELDGTITDLNDAYLGEELFHKRLAKRAEDFLKTELKPMLARMKAVGVEMQEFETFLHARHAPEANASMAKRNPNAVELDAIKAKVTKTVKDLQLKLQHAQNNGSATKAIEEALSQAKEEARDWFGAQAYKGSEEQRLSLSGMSDDEAVAIMASLTPKRRDDLQELAAMVDAINAKTLDTLEGYGLMDAGTLNAWRKAYQFYVPLHRDEAKAEGSGHPVGAGFSVKGNAAKQRTGSNHKVSHILGHIAMQREAALTRGEKNHVAKKVFLLAAQNPDEDLWSVDKPPMLRTIDPNTGIVRSGVDPAYKTRPNVLMVRIAGKDVAVVFNTDNPQAMRMVESMKNLDIGDLHVVLGLASKGTRWFASINTQYNPIFGMVNFARDLSEGMINLSTTPLAGKQLDVAKGVPSAMRAVYRQERGKGAASAANQEWVTLWEEMQATGGATGYRDLFANADERVKSLTKELKALDRGEVSQAAHAVVDWLSDYNEAMENAVRLSAYKVALDSGMTKERAASLSKNLTVNFNRKGRQTREIGALYAFFNAAIQGTTRMAETLRGPKGKQIMLGGVMLGVVNSLVGMAVMGGSGEGDDDQDEWSKIPEFIKENSLIIPLGRKDYLTIPMPLGYKVFPNIGRLAVEFATGGPDKTVGKSLGHLITVLMDAFNPLGGTQNLGQMVAPTVIDPVVALMQNKDWTGRPIYRDNNNPLDPQPGTKMTKDSASTLSKGLAAAINAITGGTQYRPGAWSPTPDQFDYVFGQLTGGLGRELLKANQVLTAPFTGDELPPHKIPLIGRLYGNTSGPGAQSGQFYENVKLLNEIENEYKGRLRNNGDVKAFQASEPLVSLVGMGARVESAISKLRTHRRAIVERDEPGHQERVKEIDTKIGELMSTLNREVAKARNAQK